MSFSHRSSLGRGPGLQGRSGFTLVELLVVIAIISILVALLLPAVQVAREAARRTQCANNIRELGTAILAYETHNRSLPPSGLVDSSPGPFECRTGKMFSWIVLILPHIEQEPLYARFNFDRTVLQQPTEPQADHLKTLLCPSDSARDKFFVDSKLTNGKRFAKGNYAAYVSPFHTDLQLDFPGALIGSGQTLAEIRDGESNTLMLAEVRVRDHEQDQRGAWALPWTGASLLAFDMHHDGASKVPYVPAEISLGWTQPPNCQGPNIDILYACPEEADAQLNKMPCAVFRSIGSLDYLSAAPRSNHSGGVNVVFVDGHVGFLPDNVDERAMALMVSANDYQREDFSQHVR